MNKLLLQYLNAQPASPSTSRPTSCDSTNSNTVPAKTKVIKYKTELCRTYEEKGYCPYGGKCRFAHGRDDLVML